MSSNLFSAFLTLIVNCYELSMESFEPKKIINLEIITNFGSIAGSLDVFRAS